MSAPPLVLLNIVGLTKRILPFAPRLASLASRGQVRTLTEILPAVTCSAQATLLTGKTPAEHGVVANGWLYRDTMEVRFWQQSNRLVQGEPLYETARRRAGEQGESFSCAKLFWWFNQGAAVDYAVTPKPHYGADGNKVFGIASDPMGLADEAEAELGRFPFHAFWGPMAGRASTEWIARCAAWVLDRKHPTLTLVYLPHLDYNPQRFGPSGTDIAAEAKTLDEAVAPLLDACERVGARPWIVSEYGHGDVAEPVFVNREFRRRGWIAIRPGPFGEMVDLYQSKAFAVVDHQHAHIYVRRSRDISEVAEFVSEIDGVDRVWTGDERREIDLDHPRSGEIVAQSNADRWFAYQYWLDDGLAPDFARTIDIHRKPGFDPAEMFFHPTLRFPKLHAARRLIAKKLGFRTLFDVVPLDPSLVKGSHGRRAANLLDRPVLIGEGVPSDDGDDLPMTAVRDLVLDVLGFGE